RVEYPFQHRWPRYGRLHRVAEGEGVTERQHAAHARRLRPDLRAPQAERVRHDVHDPLVAAEGRPAIHVGARNAPEPLVTKQSPHAGEGDMQPDLDRDEGEQAAGEHDRAAPDEPFHRDFRTTKFSSSSRSMPLRAKVSSASAGVLTMGSPLRLKEVLSTSG